jgi:hypothetical protein
VSLVPVDVSWELTARDVPGEYGIEGNARVGDQVVVVVYGHGPVWRSPHSVIDEELSPIMDELLSEEVGELADKAVIDW